MSGRVIGLVLEHQFDDAPRRPEIDPAARFGSSAVVLKMVMIAIANRCDDQGRNSHPGIREIAQAAQVNLGTAVIALAHLRIDGYLHRVVHSDHHRADTYRLDLERLEVVHTRACDTRAETAGHTRAARVSDTRAARVSGHAHNVLRHTSSTADAVQISSSTDNACQDCGQPTGDRHRWRCEDCQATRPERRPS